MCVVKCKVLPYQARRQDSVTGRAEINFGGHEKFFYVNSRGARGAREFYFSGSNKQNEDQKKRSSVQKFPQFLVIFSKF